MGRRKCQTASSTPQQRNLYEVLTDDEDYFKVIAGARLTLEKDIALTVPCIENDERRGQPQAVVTRRKRVCGKCFQCG